MNQATRVNKLQWITLWACVAVWGVNSVATKIALNPSLIHMAGNPVDVVLFNALRFAFSAVLLGLIICLIAPKSLKVDPAAIGFCTLSGIVAVAGGETIFTEAIRRTSIANVTLLAPGTMPLFVAIWSAIVGRYRLQHSTWIGGLLALVGVGIVAGYQGVSFTSDNSAMIGNVLALSRSLIHALYLVYLTQMLKKHDAINVTFYNVLMGVIWFIPILFFRHTPLSIASFGAATWFGLAWSVIPTTVIGYSAWNWAMGGLGQVASVRIMYYLPLFGGISAWILLGEPLGWNHWIGGAIILAGVSVSKSQWINHKIMDRLIR